MNQIAKLIIIQYAWNIAAGCWNQISGKLILNGCTVNEVVLAFFGLVSNYEIDLKGATFFLAGYILLQSVGIKSVANWGIDFDGCIEQSLGGGDTFFKG